MEIIAKLIFSLILKDLSVVSVWDFMAFKEVGNQFFWQLPNYNS